MLLPPFLQGRQTDSRIVRGEVFSNRVIRTDMPMTASKVKLLLVQESISYHRVDKFESIIKLHLQEEEFVKNICNKIKALKPDLILVRQYVYYLFCVLIMIFFINFQSLHFCVFTSGYLMWFVLDLREENYIVT